MPSGLQVWSGENPNKLLIDITGRMVNLVDSFRIPLYIYATDGFNGVHEIPQQIVSGTYKLNKTYPGDVIFIPMFDDPNFVSVTRGTLANNRNYNYKSGERCYSPPNCELSGDMVNWSFDFRLILPSSDWNCISIGGFTVQVGFY